MAQTSTGTAIIEALTADGFTTVTTGFADGASNQVIRSHDSDTYVLWNAVQSRIEFWIYGQNVATIAAESGQTNGEMTLAGQMFELPVDEESDPQSDWIEFDSLIGCWRIGVGQDADTRMWVYSNGNCRVTEVLVLGYTTAATTDTWNGFEGTLNLDADGVLTVSDLWETITIDRADIITPSITADGTATTTKTSSGAATLGEIEADGAATRGAASTGAATLGAVSVSGNAVTIKVASGAITLSAVTAQGQSKRTIVADSGLLMPQVTADGAADRGVTVTAAILIPSITADGESGRFRVASGAVQIAAITVDGFAQRVHTASGSPALPAVTADGAGSRIAIASGAVIVTAITGAGTAARIKVASGDVELPAAQADGAGYKIILSTGDPAIPTVTATGEAARSLLSSGAISIGAIVAYGNQSIGSDAEYQYYRVVALDHKPGTQYRVVRLEAIQRPVDL